MRDHLYRSAAIVAVALLLDYIPVDAARRHVTVLRQIFVDKALIVPQIQIRLRTIVCDEYLAMLERVHGSGVHIQIRVKFLHGHAQAARF